MNFKKPKMENLTGALVTGGSAVAGAAASNLLVAELTKKPSGDEKKDKSKRQLVKGGAVAAALLGLACVDGNDTSANVLRGAFVGFEPVTFCMPCKRASQLRQSPIIFQRQRYTFFLNLPNLFLFFSPRTL